MTASGSGLMGGELGTMARGRTETPVPALMGHPSVLNHYLYNDDTTIREVYYES
jgi:hypothetical protein